MTTQIEIIEMMDALEGRGWMRTKALAQELGDVTARLHLLRRRGAVVSRHAKGTLEIEHRMVERVKVIRGGRASLASPYGRARYSSYDPCRHDRINKCSACRVERKYGSVADAASS